MVHEGRVERRAIKAGTTEGDQVEIVSGVTAGEQVVVDAPATMKDGDRVTVKER